MALFQDSSLRPASSHRPKAPPKPPRRGSAVNSELAEKLRSIAAAASAPEEAIEPALLAILEETRMQAGAVCLYDPHRQLLRLVAEVGLSDEGCRALRNVGSGSTSGWEMPHQSLLSRRAYVIENASENRFVPSLIDDPKAAYNVACLPLYAGTNPVGSLIIVAIRPAVFGDQQIKSLQQPQRELVNIIEALRQRAAQDHAPSLKSRRLPASAESLSTPTPAAGLTQASSNDSTSEQAARGDTPELAGAEDQRTEIRRLRTQLAETEARAQARLEESVTALQCKHEELAAEAEHLRTQLSEAEAAGAAREAQTRQAHAAEVEHLLELLNDAREVAARDQRISEELKSTLELERQQAAEAEQRAAQANERAAEQAAELERLRTRLAKTQTATEPREQKRITTGQITRDEFSAELERLRTQLAATASTAQAREEEYATQLQHKQQEFAVKLEAAAARERQAKEEGVAALERERSLLAALKTDLATLQEDRAAQLERLTALLTESEAGRARDTTHIGELKQANARLAEKLEAACTLEESLQREINSTKRLADERAAELKDARDHAAAAQHALDEARAEATAMEEALAEAQAQIDEIRRTLEPTALRVEQLEAQAHEAEDRRTQLERELDTVQTKLREAEQLLTASRQAPAGPSIGGAAQTSAPSAEIEVVSTKQPFESSAPPIRARDLSPDHASVASAGRTRTKAEARTTSATAPQESGAEHIVIIDREESWRDVALDERGATVLPPGADLLTRLSAPHRDPILLNLAAEGSLGAVSTLREAGLKTRFLAYIGAPGTGKALRLGMLETTPSPLDPEAVLAALDGYLTAGKRLLTAVADVDAVMSLRQALSRRGVSVSMAWDSTQATDLVTIIRPEVAVIDLDLPPRSGYRLVSALADMTPVPSIVLISKRRDEAERFAAEAADRSRARSLVSLQGLLAPPVQGQPPPHTGS